MNQLKFRDFTFPIFELPYNVYTCKDAASAKGISLKEELKSLILRCNEGKYYVVHLTGDKGANFKAIRRALSVRDVKLADKDAELSDLDTLHGAVFPFHEKIWNLPNLISADLLELKRIYTNSGKLNSFIAFDPKLLLENPLSIVGNFSKYRIDNKI